MTSIRRAESNGNMSSGYHLEIHRGDRGLSHLFDDWLFLADNLEHPKPSHFPHWYKAFLDRPDVIDSQAIFIGIYRDKQLAAIFPLGQKLFRRFNLLELSIPIREDLDTFPDVIVARNQNHAKVFSFFLKAMKSRQDLPWDVLVVRNTLDDSHISHCIRKSTHLLTLNERTGNCSYIRVNQFKNQETLLSKNSRANLRKANNQLRKVGNSEFACASDYPSIMQAFKTFLEVEASGWKGKTKHGKQHYYAGNAISLNESKLSFYQSFLSAFARCGYVEIYSLVLNGETISTQIGLVLKGTCYLVKIAYIEDYAKLSPGNLLLERVIQHHAQVGKVSTINLISDYNWHNVWKVSRLNYETYHCFNSNWKGIIYSIGMRLQTALRRGKIPTENSAPGCQ